MNLEDYGDEAVKAVIGAATVLFWTWVARKDLVFYKAYLFGPQTFHGFYTQRQVEEMESKYKAMGLEIKYNMAGGTQYQFTIKRPTEVYSSVWSNEEGTRLHKFILWLKGLRKK